MKQVIAITGLSGALGKNLLASIPKSFKKKYIIVDLYNSKKTKFLDSEFEIYHKKLDLIDTHTITLVLASIKPSVVIHLAAITHIDRCEQDKVNGINGVVWKTNVLATQMISDYCKKNDVHLLYLSTECVFDGKSKIKYKENSRTNPISWYGYTKAHAETMIKNANMPWTIIRSVKAYDLNESIPTLFSAVKKSFVHNRVFFAVSDQLLTPTFIPDIYKVIWMAIKNKHYGIFHVSPRKSLTPYQFAVSIGKHFGYDLRLVKKQTMIEFMGESSAKLRLKNACLDSVDSSKILKYRSSDIDSVLGKIK